MSTDLLERRAERGEPRGAANIWADAQTPIAGPLASGPNPGVWIFRAAVAISILVAGFFLLNGLSNGDSSTATDEVPRAADSNVSPGDQDEPLPLPLLVDGMSLDHVTPPINERFDADELFEPVSSSISRATFGEDEASRRIVFANPDDPLNDPIMVIDAFAEGGFRPVVVNIDESERQQLIDSASRTGDAWSIGTETGLVSVADFEWEAFILLDLGWQFDFSSGSDRVTLQALAIADNPSLQEWAWLALLLRDDVSTELTETSVLDQPGVLLTETFDERVSEQLFWTDGDFAYRLSADTIVGDTAEPTPVAPAAERLIAVDQDVWVAAVLNSVQFGSIEGPFFLVALISIAIALACIVYLLVKRRFKLVAVVALMAFVLVALAALPLLGVTT